MMTRDISDAIKVGKIQMLYQIQIMVHSPGNMDKLTNNTPSHLQNKISGD